MKRLLLILILLVSKGYSQSTCTNFDINKFTLNGNAFVNSSNEAELTQDQGGQSGTVWASDKLDLQYDITIKSQIYLGTNDGSGADGIAFVLQPLSVNAGSSGGGIGYKGITPSLAVEFDTYYNGPGQDPSPNDHVALVKNGNASSEAAHSEIVPYVALPNIEDGVWHPVVIQWVASLKKFTVTFDGNIVIDTVLDIKNSIFSGIPFVYWGFTAATGGSSNLQKVKIDNYCVVTQCSTPTAPPTGISPQVFCSGATVSNLVATGTSIKWYSSATSSTALLGTTVLNNGTTYYATQTVGDCQSNTRLAVQATVNTVAIPTGISPQVFCKTASITDLVVSGTDLKWYNTALNGTVLAPLTNLVDGTTYYCSQTLNNCQSARLPITVSVANPIANLVSNKTLCVLAATNYDLTQNNATVLGSQSSTLFQVGYFASQSDLDTNTRQISSLTITTGVVSVYTKVYLASNPSCFASTSFTISAFEQPTVNQPTNYSVCEMAPYDGIEIFNLELKNTEIVSAVNATKYNISYHSSQSNADLGLLPLPLLYQNTLPEETLFVRIENKLHTSCFSTTSFKIKVSKKPTVNVLQDITVCDDVTNDGTEKFDLFSQNATVLGSMLATEFTVTYHSSFSEAQLGTNILPQFYTNTSNNQIIYVRIANTGNTTCFETSSFKLIVKPSPILALATNWAICNATPIVLNAGAGFNTYSWSTGATTPAISVNTAGNYTITVTKDYSGLICSSSKTINVTHSSVATINDVRISDWTETENSLTIEASGDGDYEYSIDNVHFQNSPVFYDLNIGIYTVYVKDKNGCGIISKQVPFLNYPKYFTPNNDGINDYWSIKNSKYESNLKTYVFDRYGKLIANFSSSSIGWDGKYNGEMLPATDYWFLVIRQDGREFRGHFTLKR